MQIWTDACLALLAAVGIWSLGRMVLDRLLGNVGGVPPAWIVMKVTGDGEGLDVALDQLLRLRRRWGVVLVDCGLSEQGRALAVRLTAPQPGVRLCRWDQLGAWMKEAEVWTRQANKTK